LNGYLLLVREGKSLDEALKFSQFVLWSGVVPLCKNYASDSPFPSDGLRLQKKAERLQVNVRKWYLREQLVPYVEVSEMENISRKLDLILLKVSPLVAAELKVVQTDC
jgi:hypothetical protein